MAKICLVEDETNLNEMIVMNLQLEGHEVVSLADGKAGMEIAEESGNFDLVILDVMLPHFSGLQICEAIRKYSNVPVLFLSARGTSTDKIAGLKTGGNDYLSKPFELEELLLRVKVLTTGVSAVQQAEESFTIGNKTVNFETFEVVDQSSGEQLTLSKREIDLLHLFAEKEGKVVSRDEILDRLWGKDQFPTARTIDNYILNFRKIFEKDPKHPIHFHSIRSVGYKFTSTASN
jgi:two-component system, OmpR family, alkaline phosphatase synthesis response regulator PhoP